MKQRGLSTYRHQGEIVKLKARVRERDGFECVRCGMTNDEHVETFGHQLHVHRKSHGSLYTEEGCETVCQPCHTGLHRERVRKRLPSRGRDKITASFCTTVRFVEFVEEEAGRLGMTFGAYIVATCREKRKRDRAFGG